MKEQGGVFSGIGYKNENESNQTYLEFHIDDHLMFMGMGTLHPFGENLFVGKLPNEKPLLIWGQDECIFCQFIFHNMCWTGPNGEMPLMPKTDGQGLMISRFVNREYEFGRKLTKKQLPRIL